jgi:hypothetical protein
MNHQLLAFVAAAGLCCAARADFTGPTAPGNFTVSNTGTLLGSGALPGTAVFTASQLQIAGANTPDAAGCSGGNYSVIGPCEIRVSINLPGTYIFSWSYSTADQDGPAGDMFGVIADGARFTLSDLGGAVSQSGQLSGVATTSFAWFMNCTDCTGGQATVTISNFTLAPVPEPGTAAMLMFGLVGVAGMAAVRAGRERAR